MTTDSRAWIEAQIDGLAAPSMPADQDDDDDQDEQEGDEPEEIPTGADAVAAALADPEVDALEWAAWSTGATAEEWRAACREAGLPTSTPQPRMHQLPYELRVQIEQARLDERIAEAQRGHR